MTMSTDHAECSAIRSVLDEVLERVERVADRYRATPDSAITAELDQAERSLVSARRAIDRAIGTLAR